MNKLILVGVSALIAAVPAQSMAASKWMDGPPGLPAGAKFRVVSGDPGKEGLFAVRIQLPANYKIPPHNHPTDEIVSVKSGGPLAYGMGDTMDQASAGSLEKGYHVTLMGKMNHWAATTAPTEIEVKAMGPFAITYVNPSDDPRK